jgi:hypothetical protein
METRKPLRFLSLGAGVQSTTVLLMMIHGEIERADHVIFADTGWEPAGVYEHLARLEELMVKHDLPFHKVGVGNIREDAIIPDKRSATLPFHMINADGSRGMIRRQCTNDYKIQPLLKKQRELVGLARGQRSKEHLGTTVIGISWDETQRMRDAAFSWLRNEYPLVDLRMTREDCLAWCAKNGYALPPRSACIGCPFKSDAEWRRLKETMPEEWADAVAFDKAIRDPATKKKMMRSTPYLHKSAVPLDEVDLRTEEERGIMRLFEEEFGQECEGMCGL